MVTLVRNRSGSCVMACIKSVTWTVDCGRRFQFIVELFVEPFQVCDEEVVPTVASSFVGVK